MTRTPLLDRIAARSGGAAPAPSSRDPLVVATSRPGDWRGGEPEWVQRAREKRLRGKVLA